MSRPKRNNPCVILLRIPAFSLRMGSQAIIGTRNWLIQPDSPVPWSVGTRPSQGRARGWLANMVHPHILGFIDTSDLILP